MSRECFWRDSKQSRIDIAQFSRNDRNKNRTKPSIRHPSTIPHYTLVSQTLFQKSATFKVKTTWVHWKKVWQGTLPLLEFIPQRRFVELTVWVPLFRVAIISLFYWFWFFHPYESWPLFSGWVVGGRIFWTNFDFFQSCLEVVLKLFGHCFWTQRAHTFV